MTGPILGGKRITAPPPGACLSPGCRRLPPRPPASPGKQEPPAFCCVQCAAAPPGARRHGPGCDPAAVLPS